MARLFQINASQGGVPKRSVAQGEVTAEGLTADRQGHPLIHGGPERALCLYSLEHIQALQQEGHPIYPGAIGENLTLSGVDWRQVVPGSRWQIGAAVQLEITSYAVPCKQIKNAFKNGAALRVHHKENPGWARAYARVLQPGTLHPGDPIIHLADS